LAGLCGLGVDEDDSPLVLLRERDKVDKGLLPAEVVTLGGVELSSLMGSGGVSAAPGWSAGIGSDNGGL